MSVRVLYITRMAQARAWYIKGDKNAMRDKIAFGNKIAGTKPLR